MGFAIFSNSVQLFLPICLKISPLGPLIAPLSDEGDLLKEGRDCHFQPFFFFVQRYRKTGKPTC